jgi:DNA-binding Lrp family transcriptional regulator
MSWPWAVVRLSTRGRVVAFLAMMPNQIAGRLSALSSKWCSAELLHGLLGIDLAADTRLMGTFRVWSDRFLGEPVVERSTGTERLFDRHAFETFLQQNGLVSHKWAAAQLGLHRETLAQVVDRLEGRGIVPGLGSEVSGQLVRERGAASLYRLFPALRHKVFASHSSMCRALHDAIGKELKIEVEPLVCVTSAILDPSEPDLADAFDAITLDPVGLRYQVWLETKKPVNLRPDVCSLKLYAKHEDALRAHVVKGSEPATIDPKLRAA